MQPDDDETRQRQREYVMKVVMGKSETGAGFWVCICCNSSPPTYVPEKQLPGNHPLKETRLFRWWVSKLSSRMCQVARVLWTKRQY